MWFDVIELGADTESVVLGEVIKTTSWREVYAEQLSVRQSEFYEGERVGRKPELVYKVRVIDYNGEHRVRTGVRVFEILRTFVSTKEPDFIELVLVAAVGG